MEINIEFDRKFLDLFQGELIEEKELIMPKTLNSAKKLKKNFLMNPAHIFGITPLNNYTYLYFMRLNNNKNSWKQCPKFKWETSGKIESSYSVEFLNRSFNLIKLINKRTDDLSIIIRMKKEFPIEIEYPPEDKSKKDELNFKIILAPIISNEK